MFLLLQQWSSLVSKDTNCLLLVSNKDIDKHFGDVFGECKYIFFKSGLENLQCKSHF